MIIVPRNDPSLNWLGRWVDKDGKFSGWGGSTLQFKFTGSYLGIELDVKNSGVISVMLDDYTDDWTHTFQVNEDGLNTITVASNLEEKEHTAFFRFSSDNYKNKRLGLDWIKVKSILIDDDAKVIEWSNDVKIAYFGDSWASAGNDFLRFLNLNNTEVHSISDPGYTSFHGLKNYKYVVGKEPISDISFDYVILGYGINDAYHRIYKLDLMFKRNIKKLIANIKKTSPSCKIILLQSPRNFSAKVDTSRYGKVLEDLSKTREDCAYISTKEIEKELTWSDRAHLDINGKHIYGKWLGEKLKNILDIS